MFLSSTTRVNRAATPSFPWAAVASLACFLINLGLLRRVFHLERSED